MTIGQNFLDTAIKRVSYYKELGNKTFEQLADSDFYWQPNESSNSIAIIIQHMAGNMLSRWTNFLSEDGEKEWRKRDEEFEQRNLDRKELLALWEKGWACFLDALKQLKEEDLLKKIYIRSEPLTVTDAINRQLAHYPYHVGQIVYIGRMIKDTEWKNLSIPKGQSQQYNRHMDKQK
ncbi:MAG: DUF1572 family protein [Chitinophagaceae bacterium]|nr:DUF1572 family protein [Chitinophagaceae bacterium]